MMKILERAREIILRPRETWRIIKEESMDIKQLYINYAAPLALIPTICSLIGMTVLGVRMPHGNLVRPPFFDLLIADFVGYAVGLAGIMIGAWMVNQLAPVFGAKSDLTAAAKVVIYSMTPFWLTGVFSLIPGLAVLTVLGFYGIFLLVTGLTEILETPGNKLALYTISILVAGLIVSLILNVFLAGLFYGPIYMRMMAV